MIVGLAEWINNDYCFLQFHLQRNESFAQGWLCYSSEQLS